MNPKWINIPLELKQRRQWAICDWDKIPRGLYGQKIKVTEPESWLTFHEACEKADELGWFIGFIISEDDPYTAIDIDIRDSSNCDDPSKWTTQNQFNVYWAILREFESYCERSVSGKGYHIWVKGKIKSGRRDGVEVYSYLRFMICTGDAVNNLPIMPMQTQLSQFEIELRQDDDDPNFELVDEEQIEEDNVVIGRAMRSSNSDKFNSLAAGNWKVYPEYPSQSEADMALMAIIAFYSKNNEQCRRIFRLTELGKRDKATKNDYYLNLTLRKARYRQKLTSDIESEIDFSNLIADANDNKKIHPQVKPVPFDITPPLANSIALNAPILDIVQDAPSDGLQWPPGLMGKLSQYMYSIAPRPVKEIAIVSALGLLAGICGKAFSLPLTGLNLYIILVARSAVGKEAINTSISTVVSQIAKESAHINNFVSFTDFASGPALLKEVVQNPSICNIAGEWGQKLLHISKGEETAGGPLATLRKEMTNLYQKSSANSIVGGLAYSDKDKNIASVTGVAYSMVGETTPDTFYAAVTPSMMADGFMSRFLTIEYKGERPPSNKELNHLMDAALINALVNITNRAQELIHGSSTVYVTFRNDAAEFLNEFDLKCDGEINKTGDESERQMWNRAALKAFRVSALLAAVDNWQLPIINMDHAKWAVELVMHGNAMMKNRIESGDIGTNDTSREKKLIKILEDYCNNKPPASYKVPEGFHANRIVTRAYLNLRVGKTPAFDNFKLGSGKALDVTIEHLISNGVLTEIDKMTLCDKMNFRGRAYQIINLTGL